MPKPPRSNIREPDAQRTHVIRRAELKTPGIVRLMSPLFACKIGKDNDRFLANVKRLLEGAGAQA